MATRTRLILGALSIALAVYAASLTSEPRRASEDTRTRFDTRKGEPKSRAGGARPPSPAPLERSYTLLHGVVISRAGGALPAAMVCLTSIHANCCSAADCLTTDAAGRFVLPDLAEPAVLVAFAQGHLSRTRPLRHPASLQPEELTIVLDRGGVTVSGTVADVTGGVVRGALVTASALGREQPAAASFSDSQGHFELSTEEGAVELEAHAESYGGARIQRLAPARGVVLSLAPASSLSGYVVSGVSEVDVAGVAVTATSTDGLWAKPLTVQTTHDGSFSINGLPAGRYELSALGPSLRSDPEWAAVGTGEVVQGIEIELRPAATILGEVSVGGGPCREGFLELAGPLTASEPTRGDGRLEITGIVPGRYHASVGCADPAAQPSAFELSVGAKPVTHVWDLSPLEGVVAATPSASAERPALASIHATVKTATEADEALTPLIARSGEPPLWPRWRQGAFEFELPLGSYAIYLGRSPDVRQEVTLDEVGQTVHVELMAPALLELAGRVLDENGNAIPDAWVRARCSKAAWGDPDPPPVLSAADGSFHLNGLYEGRYVVNAEAATGRAELRDVQAGLRGLELRITPHGALRGTVMLLNDPEVHSFSLLYHRLADGETHETGGMGSWSLPWIPAGTYELVAVSGGALAVRRVRLDANEALEVEIRIDPAQQSPAPSWVRSLPDWALLNPARGDSLGDKPSE